MRSVFGRTLNMLFHNSVSLMVGQAAILLLFIILYIPILTFGIEISLAFADVAYVNPNNLWRVVSNPLSIFTLLTLFYLMSLFVLMEVYFLTTYFSAKETQKKVPIYRVVAASIYKVVSGISKGNIRLIFAAWVTLVVANLPLMFFTLRKNRFLSYLFEEVPTAWVWVAVSLVFLLLLWLFIVRKAFIFHYYLVTKLTVGDSKKQAQARNLNQLNHTLRYYFVWNLCQAVLIALVYAMVIATTMLIVSINVDTRTAVAAFITINEKLTGYIAIFMFLVSTISHFALFTHLFYHYELAPAVFAIDKVDLSNRLKKPSYKRIGIIAFTILIMVNLYFFIDAMRNGSVLNAISLDAIQITAHRGFSLDVPENTILAIERAIEEKADHIEVDVRSTKDGELVLLHDASLKRTTGLNQMIRDVTYDEIKELDAGSWLSSHYADVRIPTLREVFELAKGEANINIDLKHGGDSYDVVQILVDLIHEYNMEWQCIVTSANLEYLEEIKRIDPSIRTGHISHRLSAVVVKSDYIDVLSLKSNLVTKSTIEEIYKNNKQIFVWTVNTKSEIERVSRLGVDNIITDKPIYAREVIYRSNSDSYLVTLLKVVLE